MPSTFQIINWDNYHNYFKKKEKIVINKSIEYIKKKFHAKTIDTEFISNALFMELSWRIFAEYLIEKKLYWPEYKKSIFKQKKFTKISYKNLNNKYKINRIDIESLSNTEYASMRFLQRHSEFAENFNYKFEISEINIKLVKENKLFKKIYDKIDKFNIFNSLGFYPLEKVLDFIYLNTINLENIKRFPKIIFISNHGIYRPEQNLYLCFAKLKGSKVICLQPGLPHSLIKYHDQVEFEKRVSNIYLSYGHNENIIDGKVIGSPYSNKKNKKEISIFNEVVILPQVPRSSIPRPISNYWGQSYLEFKNEEMYFITSLKKVISNCTKPLLRCKSLDYKYYQKLFKKNHISCDLEAATVDSEDFFSISKKVFVMYLSSALIEASYSGSETFMSFDENHNVFNRKIADEIKPYLYKSSSKFIEKYVIKTDPETFNKDLITIVENL